MVKLLNKYKVLLFFILLIVYGGIYSRGDRSQQAIEIIQADEAELGSIEEEIREENQETLIPELQCVPVFICGEVKQPGVYEVMEDSLIQEVVMKAGGFTEEADQDVTNLARVVMPHEQIYIPKVGEKIDKIIDSYENRLRENMSNRTNINKADSQELEKLPGIGQVKARQIIAYREEHGTFKKLEDLKNVVGIGQKTYEGLLEYITIE